MAKNSYDQLNKQKIKYESTIAELTSKIEKLEKRVEELETKNTDLRQRLYDAGEGKGENNRLKKVIKSKERENVTLTNQIKELDGSKLISSFSEDRQELIRKIQNLNFNYSIFNSLAFKFKDGLDNVIEIAYRIKNNYADDMDYFTFVFRDDVVGLLEKMLRTILNKREDSASKFLVKLSTDAYRLPEDYYRRIPKLNDKEVVNNILSLINLESTGYHGSQSKNKSLKYDQETKDLVKPDRFLNLENEDQLEAIFTLLEFMYDVFTNKDHEQNLMSISQSWFKTL